MDELRRMLNIKNPPGRKKMSDEKKVTNKEAAIKLVLGALKELDDIDRASIESVLDSRTTESRCDKIREEVQKQRGRCEKLFAAYLEGRA